MDDEKVKASDTDEPLSPDSPLPNIEAFTNQPKVGSRRNLYIGVGIAVILALAVSSFLIVRNAPK